MKTLNDLYPSPTYTAPFLQRQHIKTSPICILSIIVSVNNLLIFLYQHQALYMKLFIPTFDMSLGLSLVWHTTEAVQCMFPFGYLLEFSILLFQSLKTFCSPASLKSSGDFPSLLFRAISK